MRLKMMTGDGNIDYDSLTAMPRYVMEGCTFFGAGSDEEQTGELPDKSQMGDSPGVSEDSPNVPIYYSTPIITKDTTGQDRIAMCPDWGCYPGGEKAFIGCTPRELGITQEIIANGATVAGVTGSYGTDSNFKTEDLKEGKVAYGKDGRIVGEAKNYGVVVKTLAAGESYVFGKGIYDAGKVTAKDLASQTGGNAEADQLLSGKTAWVNGKKIFGIMPNRGGNQISRNAYWYTHTDGKTYMINWMPGGYYSGWQDSQGLMCAETWLEKRYVDQLIGRTCISAFSARGFAAGESEGYQEQSFTMPRDGMVYYGGGTASYGNRGTACEIRKNNILIDERNINDNNSYAWRGTMFNKSFSAKKGDVIKVLANCWAGSHAMSCIQAIIIY